MDHAAKLETLIGRLTKEYPDVKAPPIEHPIDPDEPLLAEFVRSMLLWESTQAKAAAAMKRLAAGLVDFNELRVCLPRDLVRLIGANYPAAQERAERLRAALNDVYKQKHAVTLKHVQDLGKREAKQYLESLNGSPSFVSARVALLHHGNHSMPVDSRIHAALVEAKALPPEESVDCAAGWIERRVRAGELTAFYLRLQERADELKDAPAASSAASAPPPGAAPPGHEGENGKARKGASGKTSKSKG